MFTDSFNDIESHLQIPTVYIKVNNTLNPHLIFQHYGCQDVVIHHENASDIFVQFEKLIRLNSERFNMRRYVVSGDDAMKVFSTKELEHVSNLLVVVPKNGSYDLLTHLYGDMNGSNEVVLVDTWFPQNESFLNGYHLFPDKLYNQNGRQLKIGTFTYEPYCIVEDDNTTIHGTETSFIFEFVKKHNLTPVFTIITGDDLWGDIYDNWTGIGILGSLVRDDVDVGYGSSTTD